MGTNNDVVLQLQHEKRMWIERHEELETAYQELLDANQNQKSFIQALEKKAHDLQSLKTLVEQDKDDLIKYQEENAQLKQNARATQTQLEKTKSELRKALFQLQSRSRFDSMHSQASDSSRLGAASPSTLKSSGLRARTIGSANDAAAAARRSILAKLKRPKASKNEDKKPVSASSSAGASVPDWLPSLDEQQKLREDALRARVADLENQLESQTAVITKLQDELDVFRVGSSRRHSPTPPGDVELEESISLADELSELDPFVPAKLSAGGGDDKAELGASERIHLSVPLELTSNLRDLVVPAPVPNTVGEANLIMMLEAEVAELREELEELVVERDDMSAQLDAAKNSIRSNVTELTERNEEIERMHSRLAHSQAEYESMQRRFLQRGKRLYALQSLCIKHGLGEQAAHIKQHTEQAAVAALRESETVQETVRQRLYSASTQMQRQRAGTIALPQRSESAPTHTNATRRMSLSSVAEIPASSSNPPPILRSATTAITESKEPISTAEKPDLQAARRAALERGRRRRLLQQQGQDKGQGESEGYEQGVTAGSRRRSTAPSPQAYTHGPVTTPSFPVSTNLTSHDQRDGQGQMISRVGEAANWADMPTRERLNSTASILRSQSQAAPGKPPPKPARPTNFTLDQLNGSQSRVVPGRSRSATASATADQRHQQQQSHQPARRLSFLQQLGFG
eukprot:m.99983 g.99983  ORF g.99983 m.99983 type:complete len:690 (-) comp13155_c0_seq1:152-2221(-)